MKNQSILSERRCVWLAEGLCFHATTLAKHNDVHHIFCWLLASYDRSRSVGVLGSPSIRASTRPKIFYMICRIFRSWVHTRGKSSQPASRPSSTPSFTTQHQPHRPHHREKKRKKGKRKTVRIKLRAHIPELSYLNNHILIRAIFL